MYLTFLTCGITQIKIDFSNAHLSEQQGEDPVGAYENVICQGSLRKNRPVWRDKQSNHSQTVKQSIRFIFKVVFL